MKRVIESSVLFISIIKWIFLATFAGAIVGFSTAVFIKLLEASIGFTGGYGYYYLSLPAVFVLSSFIVRRLAPEAAGHGTEKIIEAVHRRSGRIKPHVVPVKLFATVITIAAGGSAGKEGPAAQIGAALCSSFSSLLRFDDRDRRKLVICGISAGFASVFGTPIAGAIFGVEVLFVGGLLYDVLLPSFVAGIVSHQVSSWVGVSYFHEPIKFVPLFSSSFFIKVVLSGLFFGLCSFLFIEMLRLTERINNKMKINGYFKSFLGGAAVALLAFAFSTRYLGLGLDTIKTAVEGGVLPASSSLLKMLFTSITLSFGGSGGIITPIFFIGSTAGNLFGSLPGFQPSVFAAIGMVSLLAGTANTPISASIMAVELFGPQVGPYASVACVISFLMTGHRSVYPSQIMSMSKSTSLSVEKGKEIGDMAETSFKPRKRALAGGILMGIRKVRKKPSRDKGK